jgi:hypothetical protein
MIELTGTIHDIELLEGFCSEGVESGNVVKLKDSETYDEQQDGFDVNEEDNKFSVKVYNSYLVKVKRTETIFGYRFMAYPWNVKIRFWYDKRQHEAGFKITEEGLQVIMQSASAVEFLQKLNGNLGSKDMNMDRVAALLNKVLDSRKMKQ